MAPAHIPTKRKIFNDPVYGFITITDPLIFSLVEHPYFQRLRRITQLGLTNIVYGGANHSRFQHALGAMNLMGQAIDSLRNKKIEISEKERQAAKIAILLHDIGHGPFSHALENSIITNLDHEAVGLHVLDELNIEYDGELEMAINIFKNQYHKKFLHQLVSSQLDMDRLDYLKRDSFFTGVSEGVIGSERIIKMLTVHDGELAVEAKGIYSLEKFLMARRLMYWQVYLHKTVLSAEFMLMNILQRAKEVYATTETFCTPALKYFLEGKHAGEKYWLPYFMELDDFDILTSVKVWQAHEDRVLAELSRRLVKRKLLKIKTSNRPHSEAEIAARRSETMEEYGWNEAEAAYLVYTRSATNAAYNTSDERINVVYKDGAVADISEAADMFRFSSPATQETKHFLYFPALGQPG